MQLIPDNWRDIQRYYENSFVKFRDYGDRLFYIDRVREDMISGKDEDGTDFVLYLSPDFPYELDFVLPNRSVYQLGKTIAMLNRIPARQYCRGINGENTRITDLANGERLNVNFKNLKAFISKQNNKTLREAIYGKSKNYGEVMNNRMWFCRPSQRLYIDHVGVGQFDREQKKFGINAAFRTELLKLIQADPFEVEVVNV